MGLEGGYVQLVGAGWVGGGDIKRLELRGLIELGGGMFWRSSILYFGEEC